MALSQVETCGAVQGLSTVGRWVNWVAVGAVGVLVAGAAVADDRVDCGVAELVACRSCGGVFRLRTPLGQDSSVVRDRAGWWFWVCRRGDLAVRASGLYRLYQYLRTTTDGTTFDDLGQRLLMHKAVHTV